MRDSISCAFDNNLSHAVYTHTEVCTPLFFNLLVHTWRENTKQETVRPMLGVQRTSAGPTLMVGIAHGLKLLSIRRVCIFSLAAFGGAGCAIFCQYTGHVFAWASTSTRLTGINCEILDHMDVQHDVAGFSVGLLHGKNAMQEDSIRLCCIDAPFVSAKDAKPQCLQKPALMVEWRGRKATGPSATSLSHPQDEAKQAASKSGGWRLPIEDKTRDEG